MFSFESPINKVFILIHYRFSSVGTCLQHERVLISMFCGVSTCTMEGTIVLLAIIIVHRHLQQYRDYQT